MLDSLRDRSWLVPFGAIFTASWFPDSIDSTWVLLGFTGLGSLAGWVWQSANPDDVANRLAPWSVLILIATIGIGMSDDYRQELVDASAVIVCILAIGVGVITQERYGRGRTRALR